MEREELYKEYRKATILKGVTPIGKRRFNGIVDTLNELEQVKNNVDLDGVSNCCPRCDSVDIETSKRCNECSAHFD